VTSRTAATRYARALFDVALNEQANLQALEAELASFAGLFTEHVELAKVLLNPAVPTPRKRAAMVELTKNQAVSPILRKLLILLAERDRLILLPDLVAAYRDRLADHLRIVRAEVTTAAPLAPERLRQIERSLSQATGRSVTMATKVDPALIGGLVARVGGTVYDASLTTQLEKMKRRLAESI
jgi:F-type H+-transporting ATPase subunit delta